MASGDRLEEYETDLMEVGKRKPRIQAEEQLTGRTIYVDDIELPGMLYAKAVLAQYPHAKILNVDTSQARRLIGVKAVATAIDVPHNNYGRSVRDQELICSDKVRHLGDLVALVAATDEEIALEAAGLIKVDYEPLPKVDDVFSALEPEAPLLHGGKDNRVPFLPDGMIRIRCGDIEKGFREADLIVEDVYITQSQEHAALETQSAVAKVEGGGRVTVWSMTSMPFVRAQDTAEILGLPFSKVRFIVPQVGGAFGGKNEAGAAPHVALLALMTGKPVKWTWTREEEFLCSTVRHRFVIKHKTGVKKNGRLVAKQIESIGDAGAYCSGSVWVLEKNVVAACGPYHIPNVWVDGYLVYTNKQVTAAMRGYGVTQGTFAAESQMDRIAKELNLDPLEIRLINVLKDGDTIPCGQKVEAVSIRQCLIRASSEFQNAAKITNPATYFKD